MNLVLFIEKSWHISLHVDCELLLVTNLEVPLGLHDGGPRRFLVVPGQVNYPGCYFCESIYFEASSPDALYCGDVQ